MKNLFLSAIAALFVVSAVAQNGKEKTFQKWALTPPMGWNSWDCYGPTVVESEVKVNADYMATKLKDFGWEYVVVDIRWFVENDKSGGYNQTNPIYVYDAYGRYTPALNRFPSAANGQGFKPLADYMHARGLKFGIHIMRGIPKIAVDKKLPVEGTNGITCDMIASNDSACTWLKDNYKVDCAKEGAQAYYNSIFNMYAQWGVDFVKVDDLSRPYHTGEIEMIRQAIDQTGRPMVLSISPGETPITKYEHVQSHANMWRTVDDFWDNWSQLQYQFSVCKKWAPYIAPGTWPDADMLPLGKISIRGERGSERYTNFTKNEQYTLMSLWSIFKSPLMFGGNLPENDKFTDSLLTNSEVLYMHNRSVDNHQVSNLDGKIVWAASDPASGDTYAALFNTMGNELVRTKNALYRSGTISYLTTGYGQDLEVDIPEGSTQLCLVATDGGDSYDCDHADWINPVLEMTDGSKVAVTDLTYLKGSTGWGNIAKNTNINGGTLKVNGQSYAKGWAVHANSILLFSIPQGAKKFKAFVGIDDTGITQANSASTVEFLVFNEDPTTRTGVDPVKAVANTGLICRSFQKEGVSLNADITNAKKLYLVVTDAGDNYNYDHGNWINPVLKDADGNETKLTSLNWTSATSGWSTVKKGKNIDGGTLIVNGKTYTDGYGVNSNSIITFDLPEGHKYTSFSAFCGYDAAMENVANGVTMEFMAFTQDPTPDNSASLSLDLQALGYVKDQPCTIFNMWSGKEVGTYTNDAFAPIISQHGVGLYRIKAANRAAGATVNIQTEKSSYLVGDSVKVNVSVSTEAKDGWVQLFCNEKLVGVLPISSEGRATYWATDLSGDTYSFQAQYSGNTQVSSASSGALTILVGIPDGIKSLNAENPNLILFTNPKGLVVNSIENCTMPIYSIAGNLLSTAQIQEGENVINLSSGQYIANGAVFIIK